MMLAKGRFVAALALATGLALAGPVGDAQAAATQQQPKEPSPTNDQAQQGPMENYQARHAAIEDLVSLLSSDQIKRLEFVATSMEQAMRRVELVAESLFADAYDRLEDVEAAQAQCEAVIQGFNEHYIRLSSVGRTSGAVQIMTDADARLTGELLAAAARLVDRLTPSLGEQMSPQRLARKIFSQTTVYEASSASAINQYLEKVTSLADHTDEELARYLVDP